MLFERPSACHMSLKSQSNVNTLAVFNHINRFIDDIMVKIEIYTLKVTVYVPNRSLGLNKSLFFNKDYFNLVKEFIFFLNL